MQPRLLLPQTPAWAGHRHRSNWKPTNQAGLVSVWDPNVASTVNTGTPADGNLIDTISDAKGGFTLTKFSDTYRPTYKANILKGNACARYAGSTQYMRTASDVMPAMGVWSVVYYVKGNSDAGALGNLGNDANGYSGWCLNNGAPSWRASGAGGTSQYNASPASWLDNNGHAVFHCFNGTHATNNVFLDGAAVSAVNGTSTADPGTGAVARRFHLGNTTGSQQFTGDIFYVAVVSHYLTQAERDLWRAYFKRRFG